MGDEAYVQICKQTIKHPNSSVLGWELMVFILATFPPSREIIPFVESYINKTIEEQEEQDLSSIQRLGIYCKKQLNFIQQLGQRIYPPSETEIMWLKQVKFLH